MNTLEDLPVREGEVLAGKYRIRRVLGAGGMGAVVEAEHLTLDRRVAIKFIRPDIAQHEVHIERFLREARSASKLRSEHVAQVLDHGTLDGGLPYLVMEFLEGADLATVLKSGAPLAPDEACEIAIQACEALGEAHARGIIHRDIKPANLFVMRRVDGTPLVKVLDFGVAKEFDASGAIGADSLTSSHVMIGSPLFMSPEQMRSARNIDHRSDVWSLGIVLYQMLTGKLPFEAESFGELVMRVVEERPPSPAALREEVPEALGEIVLRCLERRADDRFQDVAQLATALMPFAPKRCQVLVDRLAARAARPRDPFASTHDSAARSASPSASADVAPTPAQATTTQSSSRPPRPRISQTGASWSDVGAPARGARTSRRVIAGAAALLIAGALVAAVVLRGGGAAPGPAVSAAPADTTPPQVGSVPAAELRTGDATRREAPQQVSPLPAPPPGAVPAVVASASSPPRSVATGAMAPRAASAPPPPTGAVSTASATSGARVPNFGGRK